MTTNELLLLLVGIALSCGVFAVLLILYPRLVSRPANAVQAAVEGALQPLIFQAIMASYRLSEKSVDQGYARLHGTDKKQLADDVYRLLPDRLGEFDVTFVKSIVTQDRFRDLVQNVFDQFDRFYLLNHEHFDDEFQAWAKKSAPSVTAAPAAQAPATPPPTR
jgi:hypothetical protein